MTSQYSYRPRRREDSEDMTMPRSYGMGLSDEVFVPPPVDQIADAPNSGLGVASVIVVSALGWIAAATWWLL